jgi:hypothetical protein
LEQVANILQQKSKRCAESVHTLKIAKDIVRKHAPWLDCRRITPTFDWMKDIGDDMIVVGVMKDSEGSCQHAVTIFRKWIFDSNEEIAFPLCKESLDCCTWEINNDERNGTCSFVKFIDGWIFCEQEKKKRKELDKCK